MSSELHRWAEDHALQEAVMAFRRGQPVLVHDFDDREGETDVIYPATAVTPGDVATLRNEAGGLICVAVSHEVAEAFRLPFLSEAIEHPSTRTDHLGYDERSSFSLSVNHRDTRTGITDRDRAKTITNLGKAAEAYDSFDFAETFRSPGHVHLLKAADGLLSKRQGHTELGLALANAAGREPAVVVCEMLNDETGHASTPIAAKNYAQANGLVYIDGMTLVETLP